MSRDPLTIGPKAAVVDASRLMREGGIRHVPVVDEAGRLIGVVSDRDLRSAALAPAVWKHLSPAMRARLEPVRVAFEPSRGC